jgi:branched-chain amino acid aminotransferase
MQPSESLPQPSPGTKSRTGDAPDRSIWLDGRLRPWSEVTVHVLSHAIQRGSLVFDYMSVHESPRGVAIFRLAEHVDRFLHSCELMGLPLEMGREAIAQAIRETVRANPGARAAKISAYFASVEIDVVPVDAHVTVAIAAYDPKADIADRLPNPSPRAPRHVKLWVEKQTANRREDIVSPQAKVSANYASPMTAKIRARAKGYDEIVLVDEDGHLAEGPTTNLFVVDGQGELLTPPSAKVLHGVTRSSIIELAKAEGIPFREAKLRPAALFEASEAFMTGTTAGVWPVESVDGRKLGKDCPGPVSTVLRERFLRVSAGEDPEFAHWLTPVED